jgi:hypothetical protein
MQPQSKTTFQDLMLSEGFLSVFFVLPSVVYFFLWAAMPPV